MFGLKQAIGTDLIQAREEQLWLRVLRRSEGNPRIRGPRQPPGRRLAVISFRIRSGDGLYLHHNFVLALLNDLSASRPAAAAPAPAPTGTGCSRSASPPHTRCAPRSATATAAGGKPGGAWGEPGWARVNLNYFISAAGFISAVDLVAAEGCRLLPDYRFDPYTGLWRHAGGVPEVPLQLSEVCHGPDEEMAYPRRRARAGEDAFPGYLREAGGAVGRAPRGPRGRADRARPRLGGPALVPAPAGLPRAPASGAGPPAQWITWRPGQGVPRLWA